MQKSRTITVSKTIVVKHTTEAENATDQMTHRPLSAEKWAASWQRTGDPEWAKQAYRKADREADKRRETLSGQSNSYYTRSG